MFTQFFPLFVSCLLAGVQAGYDSDLGKLSEGWSETGKHYVFAYILYFSPTFYVDISDSDLVNMFCPLSLVMSLLMTALTIADEPNRLVFISEMDVNYVFAAVILIPVFILLHRALIVFYGLSSSTGRSSVILGFHVQLNCDRVGDP